MAKTSNKPPYRFMQRNANVTAKDKKARGVGPSKDVAESFIEDKDARRKKSLFMKKGRDSKTRSPTGR